MVLACVLATALSAGVAYGAGVETVNATDKTEDEENLQPGKPGLERKNSIRLDSAEPASSDIVARIDGRVITAGELDVSMRMQLHDLDVARYELRLRQLEHWVRQQSTPAAGSGAVDTLSELEIYLQPPHPPRFEVGVGNNDILGAAEAPLTVIQFLDYQSPHSKRAQPVLSQILDDYGPLVRLVARDNPLSFHRNARQAALAAECARVAGVFWPYHDRLLQGQDRLDTAGLAGSAAALGLEEASFAACLNDAATLGALKEDLAAAARLGLRTSPVFFVNGLYHKGPPQYADIARLLNGELVRLGILAEEVIHASGRHTCPFPAAHRSTLPLSVVGTLLHDNPLESTVVLLDHTDRISHTLKWGEPIPGGGRIALITRNKVYAEREGKLEFLAPADLSGETDHPEYLDSPAITVDAVVRLHRADILGALSKPQDLEAKLARGSLDLEGKRLLKLTEIEPGGLFDLLGLQARDVLMQVDGNWIHTEENSLWESLQTRRKVTLTIMRRGFPKTYQYVIDDVPK
jgi:protein-disulfide isomerase/type II secretory pathway component PulC